MARTKTTDKASVKNGRASKRSGEAYNANHNTLEATRLNQSHIDPTRIHLNCYIKFEADGTKEKIRGGHGGFDAKEHELKLYEHYYGEGLAARNARYISEGHRARCQTIEELHSNPKTAPLETIFQVGSRQSVMDKKTRTNALTRAWVATITELQSKYGENIVVADCALHRDEAEDHMHSRMLLMARDKYGHLVPNQTAALKQMGFDRPEPDKPLSRYNNPLISFTDYLRETFYRECERQGIKIDREVENYSKRQVEILEYKCEKFREEIKAVEEQAKIHRQAAQEASKTLETTMGTIHSLNAKISALERTQAVQEERNRTLTAENSKLKTENRDLKQQNQDLSMQTDSLEIEIARLTREKEAAEREREKADKERAAAVEKLEQINEHKRYLYHIYSDRRVKIYEELPAEKEKKNWRGQITQEAKPARLIVDKAQFECLEEQAQYRSSVDYNIHTISKINKKIAMDETIQGLEARVKAQEEQISQQKGQINYLSKQEAALRDELTDRIDFVQRMGLEPTFQYEQQQKIQSQYQNHSHHLPWDE